MYPEVLSGAAGASSSPNADVACEWGDFDDDYGEHRSMCPEPDCTPVYMHGVELKVVPQREYETLSESDIVDGNVACEGCDAEPYEVTRERLWMSEPDLREAIAAMSPIEVVMNARSIKSLQPVSVEAYAALTETEVVNGNYVCEGLDWVEYEIVKERLRLSLAPNEQAQIESMLPIEVAEMAPREPHRM